jgi:hypothetical protein
MLIFACLFIRGHLIPTGRGTQGPPIALHQKGGGDWLGNCPSTGANAWESTFTLLRRRQGLAGRNFRRKFRLAGPVLQSELGVRVAGALWSLTRKLLSSEASRAKMRIWSKDSVSLRIGAGVFSAEGRVAWGWPPRKGGDRSSPSGPPGGRSSVGRGRAGRKSTYRTYRLACHPRSPLTKVKLINELNEREVQLGVAEKVSWHSEYKHSAWIFVGEVPIFLQQCLSESAPSLPLPSPSLSIPLPSPPLLIPLLSSLHPFPSPPYAPSPGYLVPLVIASEQAHHLTLWKLLCSQVHFSVAFSAS